MPRKIAGANRPKKPAVVADISPLEAIQEVAHARRIIIRSRALRAAAFLAIAVPTVQVT